MNKKIKFIITIIILFLFIIWVSSSIFLYITWFDFQDFFSDLKLSINEKVIIVLILYFFRNYLLIPSTFLIIFTWFFLEDFLIWLVVSIIWVWIWIFQTYFVWYIFWEDLKNKSYYKLIEKYNNKIQNDWFKVIFIWSFFPIIPVDIFYYSAGFIKYSILKTFIAWLFWELPLIILYAYLWKEANNYTQYLWYIFLWIIILYLWYLAIKNISHIYLTKK